MKNEQSLRRTWSGGPARCVCYRECRKCGDVSTANMPLGVKIALILIGFLVVLAVGGCSSLLGPEDVAGNFTLKAINGTELPHLVGEAIDDNGRTTIEITSGSLTLEVDGTYWRTVTYFTQTKICVGAQCDIHQSIEVESIRGNFSIGHPDGTLLLGSTLAQFAGSTVNLASMSPAGITLDMEFQRWR